MLHRQLQNALEEIFGVKFVAGALKNNKLAHDVLYDRPNDFKQAILKFGKLNYRDEHTEYIEKIDYDLKIALICSLLHNDTRELVSELGLNYL
ncbi:MAG: hypothetical protein VX294_00150 [Candidatus Latescibacterota bacterium]|nr:hypothetical protein [Candidatus Latescibacterota bacterium]